MRDKKTIILAFYCTGIIVGGGILALPLVSIDTGALLLIILLILLGIIFYLIYLRLLDSVSSALKDKIVLHTGLILYDEGLKYSNLTRYGVLAFTIGLALYTLPADLVYILYGMKSLMQLATLITFNYEPFIMITGIVITLATVLFAVIYFSKTIYTGLSGLELLTKMLLMIGIWIFTIGLINLIKDHSLQIITATSAFSISLIISEYFPEHLFRTRINLDSRENILPRHKASAYLTIFKLSLIIGTPVVAFMVLAVSNKLTSDLLLFPRSIESLIAATAIIIFMYVGSGIYNILIYDWVIKHREIGNKVTLYAILFSMLTYIIFTLLILLTVDPSILIYSSIKREHAFISLSRKLETIGLSTIGLIIIVIANIFALVSVSIAYLGFTDTMSDRLNLDTQLDRNAIWIAITIIITASVIFLEINDVSKIATDALGIAGNAGGGLFLLILPWLMKDSRGKRRIDLAITFTIIITILNLFIIYESYSLIAKSIGVVSLVLVLLISTLVIIEAIKE